MTTHNQNAGIDYGLGRTNIDRKTGIRYGVISQYDVTQAWCDNSEPDYGDIDEGEELPDCAEPIGFTLDDGEYKATSCLDSDIMILSSPYYTRGAYCSPCVPGGVTLGEYVDDGPKAYCFGHDWFDNGIAPYRVFRVSDNVELVATRETIPCPQCKGTGKDTLERIAQARGINVDMVKLDPSLMARLAELHYDAVLGTFDCFRCYGKGTIEEVIVREVSQS